MIRPMHPVEDSIRQSLSTQGPCSGLLVGLSGGMDSCVLLHALLRWRELQAEPPPLRALHVNHGLQQQARQWQDFVSELCADLGVPLLVREAGLPAGASEADARSARFRAFSSELHSGELLLLAQHRDDQLETLLLRLMRGAGPAGLAGMPSSRKVGAGRLLRPLLQLPRQLLADYAGQRDLHWVDDPSNASIEFDRNYCRHELLPRVEARWPGYRDAWHKSQVLMAESELLLDELAREDLLRCQGPIDSSLQCRCLVGLSGPRQRNLLRHWLLRLGLADPGWNRLRQLSLEVLPASEDSSAVLEFDAVCLQVYAGCLRAVRQLAAPVPSVDRWDVQGQPVKALQGNGRLSAEFKTGQGLAPGCAHELELRYRSGGESLQLPGRPTKSLKKLFQEQGIAPWLRNRWPLLFYRQRLVYIPGIGAAVDCLAGADEAGYLLHWQPPPMDLAYID